MQYTEDILVLDGILSQGKQHFSSVSERYATQQFLNKLSVSNHSSSIFNHVLLLPLQFAMILQPAAMNVRWARQSVFPTLGGTERG